MKRNIIVLVGGLALIVSSIYYNHHVYPKVAGTNFDHSINAAYGEPIRVADVIDGDTIVLANGDHLRYIGIDTPEEVDQRKPVQCFAREAARRNNQLASGQTIKFYKDVSDRDQYGRWLGFVYLADGTFVNLELVKEGYAFAYPYAPDTSKSADFAQAEDYARTNKLGLWGQCQVTKLKSGRQQTNAVAPAPILNK